MTALRPDIPVIATERLTLRAPLLADLAPLTAFFETEASHFVGGPMGAGETHRAMLATLGSWALYGFGLWHIAETATGRFAGWTGLLQTAGKPEPGVAWTVLPEFQGKGLAGEAAAAALGHVTRQPGHATPATYIDPANAASIRLAERLGFVPEAETAGERIYRFTRRAA